MRSKRREYKYEGDVLLLRCGKCLRWLPTSEYHKDKSKMFGFRTTCKACKHNNSKEYYLSNRDKCIEKVNQRRAVNKETVDGYKKKYRENHRDRVAITQKNNSTRHTKELGFNWNTFHTRTTQFIKKYKLRPEVCPICWKDKDIVAHHPFYNKYEDWSRVVFCCKACHKKIHTGEIKCPEYLELSNSH